MSHGKAYLQDGWIVIKPGIHPNIDRLKTLNDGNLKGMPISYEFVDPRRARPKQRALFFALLADIHRWSGEPTEWLKEYFYDEFLIIHDGKGISLADDTSSTVTDATELIDEVVDFIFDWDVPIERGYQLLPRDEQYFQFQCIKHRKCLICGRHADLHHLEGIYGNTVGMGGNRNHVDHSKRVLACLCRKHHSEIHALGTRLFCKKYSLTDIGIKVDVKTLKRIGVKGHYEESNESHQD